jgi:hypothetical protein
MRADHECPTTAFPRAVRDFILDEWDCLPAPLKIAPGARVRVDPRFGGATETSSDKNRRRSIKEVSIMAKSKGRSTSRPARKQGKSTGVAGKKFVRRSGIVNSVPAPKNPGPGKSGGSGGQKGGT